MSSEAPDPYTPDILGIYCSACEAKVGERCHFFSEILGREREAREPHPARVNYAKRSAKRKQRKPRGA